MLDHTYLTAVVNRIIDAGKVSFDIEATGLHRNSDLVGIGLAWRERDPDTKQSVLCSIYIPVGHITLVDQLRIDTVIQELQKLFDNTYTLIFNAGYELKIMRRYGINIPKFHDVRYSAVAYDEKNCKRGLKDLADEHLGMRWGKLKDIVKKGRGKKDLKVADTPIDILGTYCMQDVEATYLLDEFFREPTAYAERIIKLERKVTPVVVDMECRGIQIDIPAVERLLKKTENELEEIREKIYKEAKQVFNLNSPKQVAEVLFDKLQLTPISGRSTDVNVLQSLSDHPVCETMLAYREKEKKRGTYLIPLLEKSEAGRMHTSFNQLGAETGRFTSRNINLQNIPTDDEIRALFIPTPGMVFLDYDYSQIEGRVFAHVANERVLREVYREGGDIHTATSERLNIPRKLAKCFHPDTEILTRVGWKRVCDVTLEDEVCQAIPGKSREVRLEWVNPTRLTYRYSDKLSHLKNEGINIRVTPDHRMLYWTTSGNPKECPASQLMRKAECWANAGDLDGGSLYIDPDILRLVVATQADGSYTNHQIRFGFSKDRKISRLRDLLKKAGADYIEYPKNYKGVSIFTIRRKTANKIKEWLDDKNFQWRFIELPNQL